MLPQCCHMTALLIYGQCFQVGEGILPFPTTTHRIDCHLLFPLQATNKSCLVERWWKVTPVSAPTQPLAKRQATQLGQSFLPMVGLMVQSSPTPVQKASGASVPIDFLLEVMRMIVSLPPTSTPNSSNKQHGCRCSLSLPSHILHQRERRVMLPATTLSSLHSCLNDRQSICHGYKGYGQLPWISHVVSCRSVFTLNFTGAVVEFLWYENNESSELFPDIQLGFWKACKLILCANFSIMICFYTS